MEQVKKLRRVALLCCHFVRNYAYFKAGKESKVLEAKKPFWVAVNNNFLDIAVLEWMKLFGNSNEVHHWKRVTEDSDSFKTNMLSHCKLTSDEFCNCRRIIKKYRDKFVAHLDSEERMYIPCLDKALALIHYYYNYVSGKLKPNETINLPEDLKEFYNKTFEESKWYFSLYNNCA